MKQHGQNTFAMDRCLAEYPTTMTHASISEDFRRRIGLNNKLTKLSVGLGDADDLIKGLSQALAPD